LHLELQFILLPGQHKIGWTARLEYALVGLCDAYHHFAGQCLVRWCIDAWI